MQIELVGVLYSYSTSCMHGSIWTFVYYHLLHVTIICCIYIPCVQFLTLSKPRMIISTCSPQTSLFHALVGFRVFFMQWHAVAWHECCTNVRMLMGQ